MANTKGSRFHPARISGRQKFLRKLEADRMNEKVKTPSLKPIDLSKQDWSKIG